MREVQKVYKSGFLPYDWDKLDVDRYMYGMTVYTVTQDMNLLSVHLSKEAAERESFKHEGSNVEKWQVRE